MTLHIRSIPQSKNWIGIYCLFLMLTYIPSVSWGAELVLTSSTLGPLKLSTTTRVSVSSLEKTFPHLKVKREIRSGDSPDFHYFEILKDSGEKLFSIVSFFENGVDENSTEVPISSLQILSKSIVDQYGVRLGMSLSEVIRLRGEKLSFGANHFNSYIGDNSIYYGFFVPSDDGNPRSPEFVAYQEAVKKSPKITSISWPFPNWE